MSNENNTMHYIPKDNDGGEFDCYIVKDIDGVALIYLIDVARSVNALHKYDMLRSKK